MIYCRTRSKWPGFIHRFVQTHKACRRHATTASAPEKVDVPRRSNGQITLDVYHPVNATASVPGVLIYLPRGPFMHDEEQEIHTLATLHSQLGSCFTVRINYRLDEEHKFPTPIHDSLAGYDWVLENILPKRAISRIGRAERAGRIAVCGEFIGGGLATALALTECRTGEPGIVAAAINNPLVDWISIEDGKDGSKENVRAASTTDYARIASASLQLQSLRKQLFMNPENYFDPFASPVLFFRSAGVEVPQRLQEIPTDDLAQLSMLDREELQRQDSSLSNDEATDILAQIRRGLPPRRKASRRFPSRALGLRLPAFDISAGTMPPFQDQAAEITHLLRQSVVRQAQDRAGRNAFGRKVLLDDELDELDDEQRANQKGWRSEAEEKIQRHNNDNLASWDSSVEGHERLLRTALWLKSRLE